MAIITSQEDNYLLPEYPLLDPALKETEEAQKYSFQPSPKKPYYPRAFRIFKQSQLSDSAIQLFVQDKGQELKSYLKNKAFFDNSNAESDWTAFFYLSVILGKENVFKELYRKNLSVLKQGESFSKSPVILAELLQAEKFQKIFDACLNPEQKKERDSTIDAFKITQLWKLREKFQTPKGSFGLYGAFSHYFLSLIDQHASSYFKDQSTKNPSKSSFYKEVYHGVSEMKNNPYANPEDLVKRLKQGEALSIQTGWQGHDINISFVKAHGKLFIAVSNRGENCMDGLEMYEAPDNHSSEKLKGVFLKLTRHCEDKSNQEYIYKTMHKTLGSRLIYLSNHQLQQVGNCVWINNMGAVHALLQLIHIKHNPGFAQAVSNIQSRYINKETYEDFHFLRSCYKGLLRKIKSEEMAAFMKKHKTNPWMANLVEELQDKEYHRAHKKIKDRDIKVLVPHKKTSTHTHLA